VGGAEAGDLYLLVAISPHPDYRVDGADLVREIALTAAQAVLGGEVEVPTLDGKGKARVPPGTQPHAVIRLKNKGIPHRVGVGRGDQLVEVTIEVPTSLTDRQRELVETLARELGEDVQPQQKTFMEKLKALFG
jgi:molecular chaperone DnaJ